MLEVSAIAFDYLEKPILANVEFSLRPGELLHLKGGNGVGKTTLLRLLAGLSPPLEGSICWNKKNIQQQLSNYQRHLCYVGHKTGLHPHLTVLENCYFDRHWACKKNNLMSLLKAYGLEAVADTFCFQLSQGQRRRVSLLRMAMTNAALWLLDEPFVALDHLSIDTLTLCIKQHLDAGGMIIMTSHQSFPDALYAHKDYLLQ